jgi:histidinol dehydrogenase
MGVGAIGDSRKPILGDYRQAKGFGRRRHFDYTNRKDDCMINVVTHPPRAEWGTLVERPLQDAASLFDTVRPILEDVRLHGDAAVMRYGEKFDSAKLTSLIVTQEEMQAAESQTSDELKQAIITAARNIETFHAAQRFEGLEVETMPGVICRQKAVAIEKVGLYVPGGTAPLFSTVLMLAVPARIAGCREIVLCTPPRRDGSVHPAILFAASTAGVSRIFKAGGIQAIAAMAYGTESVPKVYKIFGPGNRYVTAAKQLVSLADVAIDMPAGPSEVEVIADESANPVFIATDMLSQAEHGADSQSIVVTTSQSIVAPLLAAIEEHLERLPRKEITSAALLNSRVIVLRNLREVIDFTNLYAPEHLIIQTAGYASVAEEIVNAGSVFLGPYTPESAGDYASGTNHTLPTNGYARAFSGVNLDSFIRKITFQEITPEGIRQLGDTIRVMASGEELDAHRNAVTVRLETI